MIRKLLKSPFLILVFLTLLGALLRFTNLYWGEPYWFHPDERNVASAVTRLEWPDQMDPKFFAYGTVPIYLNFFLMKFAQTYLGVTEDPFFTAIRVGRIISAFLSTALIPLIYIIAKRYFVGVPLVGTRSSRAATRAAPTIAAFLTTFTVGFIQFAHFGTFEIWLTFLRLILLVLAIELARKPTWYLTTITGFIFGLAVGTKITSLVLLPAILLALIWGIIRSQSSLTSKVFQFFSSSVILLLLAYFTFIITNPFAFNYHPASPISIQKLADLKVFLNPEFVHSINSEGGIARGTSPTFYTRHFTHTIPGIYQFTRVYPFVLSWPVLIIGIIGTGWMLLKAISQTINIKRKNNLLPITYYLLLIFFICQTAFIFTLYVKWTRYTIPTLPYLIIAASVVIPPLFKVRLGGVTSKNKIIRIGLSFSVLIISWHTLQALAFLSVYTQPDSRIQAAAWAEQNLHPQDTQILSEVYDLGIVPFNNHLMHQITLFNFYELDHPSLKDQKSIELQDELEQTNTIIIPSRRVWKHTLDHPQKFPQASQFYQELFSGQLGYQKTAEFANSPSPLFNLLTFIRSDETGAEETFSVFDHPTVQIWQKQ